MGFNKRYFDKETILDAVKTGGVKSFLKLQEVDSMIMDAWATEFFEDYCDNSKKYLKRRKEIHDAVQFSSNLSNITDHSYFPKLKSPVCMLLMLYTDPSWIEVLRTFVITKYEPTEKERGKFDRQRERAIELLIKMIDSKVRGVNLGKLV